MVIIVIFHPSVSGVVNGMGVSKTIRGLGTLILIVNIFFHDEYFIQPTYVLSKVP